MRNWKSDTEKTTPVVTSPVLYKSASSGSGVSSLGKHVALFKSWTFLMHFLDNKMIRFHYRSNVM